MPRGCGIWSHAEFTLVRGESNGGAQNFSGVGAREVPSLDCVGLSDLRLARSFYGPASDDDRKRYANQR